MTDKFEVEQKYPVQQTEQVERMLSELGATMHGEQVQVDRYYAHPARDFAQTDEALRIRRTGTSNVITYKGPKFDPETKTRREIELPLPPGETGNAQFSALLEALGFVPAGDVRKHRRLARLSWQMFDVEIAFDEVDRLGSFIELEIVVAADEIDAAKVCLASLAERLNLHGHERRGYLELLRIHSRRSDEPPAADRGQ